MFQENQEPNTQFENQESPKSEKEILWDKKAREIDGIEDRLRHSIDPLVKETVIALNLSDLPTIDSCEGHLDWGTSAPWIGIEASNRPKYRFNKEKEVFEVIAVKYKVPLEQVIDGDNFEAWSEAYVKSSENGETEEYQKWRETNQPFREKMGKLLAEFYETKNAPENVRLTISDTAEGGFKIWNGGEDYRPAKKAWESMNDTEKQALQERLKTYQQEMQDFGRFLKEKFFS